MTRVVISQSMYFPWVGLLEQVRLADILIHYDDVQFSKGSFVNRVQIKMPEGVRWMSVPLYNFHFGQCINELRPNYTQDWPRRHLDMLARSFANAPFRDEAINLFKTVCSRPYSSISELSRASILATLDYFGLSSGRQFLDVKDLNIPGSGTARVLAIVKRLGGSCYITGHGARNYLQHELFEDSGISVQYMAYKALPYPQLHGDFTPYVSSLDLVANCGRNGAQYFQSDSIHWKKFIDEPI